MPPTARSTAAAVAACDGASAAAALIARPASGSTAPPFNISVDMVLAAGSPVRLQTHHHSTADFGRDVPPLLYYYVVLL